MVFLSIFLVEMFEGMIGVWLGSTTILIFTADIINTNTMAISSADIGYEIDKQDLVLKI